MRTHNTTQGGFSLIELLVVVVIIAILIAGVFGRGLLGKMGAGAQGEVQNVAQVMNAIGGYKDQGSYGPAGTDLLPVLIAGQAVPSDWKVAGAAVTNSFGGAVTATATTTGFTLVGGGLPQSVCVTLAKGVAKQGRITTSINGGGPITGPVPSATAAAQCVAGDANSLSWTSNS